MIIRSKFIHSLAFIISLGSLSSKIQSAAAPSCTIHVLPVSWDARQSYEGWKVLLDTSNNVIQVRRSLPHGKTPQNHAWDILKSIGLDKPGKWAEVFNYGSFIYVFYEVDHKDFSPLPSGYQWIRFSRGPNFDGKQQINHYLARALNQFLENRAASQSVQTRRSQVPLALAVLPIGQYFAYSPAPPYQGWYAIPGAILFDRETEPSFAFTNFYQAPVQITNFYTGIPELWPAVENYFQAMKSTSPRVHTQLKGMTPSQALANKPVSPAQWGDIRFDVMRIALEAKFAPGNALGAMLQSTNGRVLVEKTFGRSHKEVEWGADDGLSGNNHLGRMLMIVRDSYRDGVFYPYDPRNTYTLAKIQGLVPGQGLDFAR